MAEIDRTARTEQTRSQATREREVRQWKPASLIPDVNPHDGYSYRWIASKVMGETNVQTLTSRLREGYEPVTVTQHPELQLEANQKGEIEVGGLMLCRMPIEMAKQREAYYQSQTASQDRAVTAQYTQDQHSKMPKFAETSSRISKFGDGNPS